MVCELEVILQIRGGHIFFRGAIRMLWVSKWHLILWLVHGDHCVAVVEGTNVYGSGRVLMKQAALS